MAAQSRSGGRSRHKGVVNHEEQYAIWFADRETPLAWRDDGFEELKDACLDRMEEAWTDMRQLNLRSRAQLLIKKAG